MAVPSFDLQSLLAQFAQDFLINRPEPFVSNYNEEQLKSLWNPEMIGATEQLIDTSLGFINVTVGGNPTGPALVLWPSLMLRGSMWSYQYEYFRKTHRVVLIDSPGINKSEALRRYIDLRDCKDVVVSILDALGIQKCVFGGNSWGAMLAAVLPAWIPDRLIGSIVVNGTASVPTTPETIAMTIRAEALMMYAEVPDWWTSIAQQAFAGDTATKNNPDFMAFIGSVSQEDPKSIAWALRSILLGRKDMHRTLNGIRNVPVLVIAGEEDRQFPVPIVKKMADAIPTSKFVIAKGVAHLASRENPDLISKEMEKFMCDIGADGGAAYEDKGIANRQSKFPHGSDLIHGRSEKTTSNSPEKASSQLDVSNKTDYLDSSNAGEVFQQDEYRALGWIRTSIILMKLCFATGVLTIPSAFSSVGYGPGIILLVSWGTITTYYAYVMYAFRMRFPGVHNIADAAGLMGGPIAREISGGLFLLTWVLASGSSFVGLAQGFKTLSSLKVCSIIWTLIAAVCTALVSSIPTLGRLSILAWIGFGSIFTAVFIVVVGVSQVERPAAAPQEGPYDMEVYAVAMPEFVPGVVAAINLFVGYGSTPTFMPVIAEMKSPRSFTKSLFSSQIFLAASYVSFGTVVYVYCGQYVASPSLGSAGGTLEKIAYGISIPGFIMTSTLWVHLAAKFLLVRILRNSAHLQNKSIIHWATWLGSTLGISAVAFIIAEAVPFFSYLVGLIGSICCMPTCSSQTPDATPTFEVRDEPRPVPGPNEILVKLSASGLCGSDLALALGHFGPVGNILGHEGVGHIAALGSNISALDSTVEVGQRVGVAWTRDICGVCDACTDLINEGETRCEKALHSAKTYDGTFAQYTIVPLHYLARLPAHFDDLPDEEVAPILCAGVTAYKAVKGCNVTPGQYFAVSGAGGGVGALAVAYARAMGYRVIAIDAGQEKAEICKAQGAEHYVDVTTPGSLAEKVMKVTDGKGAKAVVVAATATVAYQQAFEVLAPFGTLMCVAVLGHEARVNFHPLWLIAKGWKILSSSVGTRADILEALEFVKRRAVIPKIQSAKLDDIQSLVQTMHAGKLSVQASDFSILAIAVVTFLTITRKTYMPNASTFRKVIICLSVWIVPIVTSATATAMGQMEPVSGNWCWISRNRPDLRYALTHGWRFAIIFTTILIYLYVWWYLGRHFRSMVSTSDPLYDTGNSSSSGGNGVTSSIRKKQGFEIIGTPELEMDQFERPKATFNDSFKSSPNMDDEQKEWSQRVNAGAGRARRSSSDDDDEEPVKKPARTSHFIEEADTRRKMSARISRFDDQDMDMSQASEARFSYLEQEEKLQRSAGGGPSYLHRDMQPPSKARFSRHGMADMISSHRKGSRSRSSTLSWNLPPSRDLSRDFPPNPSVSNVNTKQPAQNVTATMMSDFPIRKQTRKVEREIKRMMLLNAYPVMYVLLWIPGLVNRLMEASGNNSQSRVLAALQSSSQYIGLANAITYGFNQHVRHRIKGDLFGWTRRNSV
ncbi:hypothetical protein CkaCkLH20_00700 [Colletotrichum karsti]|uniref:Enoyl reductase (ER) domain-containing protein n=1 Tax=Colletotrichum karsti TaxID=1095194 RepID=A0A9P6IEV2_9PEZI|nr:uncharacterized protein CkaCkLH20_00700 [Colletotrichum karsti]KAF9881554.1 hypothetical protein CkaCkLH20_00700 [Colletotrichum karsti]